MKKHLYTSLLLLFGVVTGAFSQSKTISGGNDHGLIICAQGYLYTWGNNFSSTIGGPLLGIDPDYSTVAEDKVVYTPQRVKTDNLTFSMVTSGSGAFNLALSCHKVVYAWGDNQNKECGQGASSGNIVTYPSPVLKGETEGYDLDGNPGGDYLGGVTYIAASTNSGFAITSDGRVVGWGTGKWNAKTGEAAGLPAYIKKEDGTYLTNVTHISGGDDNLLIRCSDGTLWGIGPWNGQTEEAVTYAVQVLKDEDDTPLTDIRMSAAGDVCGFAVTGDGYVWSWGNGGWGGSTGISKEGANHAEAMKVCSGEYKTISGEEYLTDVKEVIGGRGHGAAVTKEGYLVYWGCNDENGGVAPTDATTAKTYASGGQGVKPVLAKYCDASGKPGEVVTDAVSISRGDNFDFMVNDKDEFYVWGLNDLGQAGTGDITVTQYNCLIKLETIPCEIQDACPTVFMTDINKCPGEEIELDCGYVVPIGKEERYYVQWWKDGKLLNTSTKNDTKATRLADKFNSATINITEPGEYKVRVEYIGTNIPCDACEPDSVTITVTDMDMPIDTAITSMNCVADPLNPTASDVICYEFTVNDKFYKASQTASFAAFSTEDSKDTLDIESAKGAGGSVKFCISGDKIAASEVHDNKSEESKDTTYTIWLEDITQFNTILLEKSVSDVTTASGNYYGSFAQIIYLPSAANLKSFSLFAAGTQNQAGTMTVTPIVLKAGNESSSGYTMGETYWTGKEQTFTLNKADGVKEYVIDCDVVLPANSVRGSSYVLAMKFSINNGGYLVEKLDVTQSNNSVMYDTPFVDSEGFGIKAVGCTANGLTSANPGKDNPFWNITFGKMTDYDCGRIQLTAKYGCPPCNQPDGIVKIEVDGVEHATSKDTVFLCEETPAVTLSVSGIAKASEPTAAFDELWFVDKLGTDATALQTDLAKTASSLPAIFWTSTKAGTVETYYVKIRDNEKPDAAACYIFDSIYVQYYEKPIAPAIDPIAFCENATDKTALTTALASADFASYTVNWYADATKSATASEPNLTTLTAAASPYTYYYSVTDKTTGCESDVEELSVTIYAIPDEPLDALDPFCKGDATVALATTSPVNSYTVTWYGDATGTTKLTATDLSALLPGTYDYSYTLTSAAPENCASDAVPYSFIVKDSTKISIDTTMSCGSTVVTTSSTPTDATVTFTLDAVASTTTTFEDPTFVGNAGTLIAKAEATGYCTNTSAPVDIYVKANAVAVTGALKVTYLKSDAVGGVFKDLMTQSTSNGDPVVTEVAGYTLNWYSETKTPLSGCPTPEYPSDAVTSDQTYTYYVSQSNADGCESELEEVKVTVYLTPAPTTKTLYYCKNSSSLTDLETAGAATINDPNNSGKFSFNWYDLNGADLGGSAPTPNVSAAGKYTYQVSQKSSDGAESSKVDVDVYVYDVMKPSLATENVLTYCASASLSSALVANQEKDEANQYMASSIVWTQMASDGTYAETLSPTVSLDVTNDTVYKFKVHQTYTIQTTNEVCIGEDVETEIAVTYVPKVTTEEVLYLKASAVGNTFTNNLLQQNTNAVTGMKTGATLQWYEDDCNTPIAGTPTPTLNPSTPEGEDQIETYCVSQVVNGCLSTPVSIIVRISDALPPTPYTYHYCEGEMMEDLKAVINPQAGKSTSDYTVFWYTTKPTNTTTATADYEGTSFPMGNAIASVVNGAVTTQTYFVAQKDNTTGAVSAAQAVNITIYPKPIVVTTDPAAVCEESVDLGVDAVRRVSNVTETCIYTYRYQNALCTQLAQSSGEYTIAATYMLPVDESAAYTVITPADKTCVGEATPVNVVINDLSIPDMITGEPSTCPGTSITLEAIATSNDPGTVTYTWGGDAANTVAAGHTVNEQQFVSGALSMNAGDQYTYTVTAKAGVCVKEIPNSHTITIGNGVVSGFMRVSEEGNNDGAQTLFENSVSRIFYSCGEPVTIDVSDYTGDKDFVWYKDNQQIEVGATLVTPAYAINNTSTYKVKYTNVCEATADITIITIPLSTQPISTEDIEMCEGTRFETALQYTFDNPGVVPNITWYRNGVQITTNENKSNTITDETTHISTYFVDKSSTADDGTYSYKATFGGCISEGTTNTLDVKEYIRSTIAEKPFIVKRHGTQTLPISIATPANGLVENISWRENGVETVTGNPNILTDVTADHYYEIILSDPNYCNDTLKATVYVDAELHAVTSLRDTLCIGNKDVMTIDTTGTGTFRQENGNPHWTLTCTMGGVDIDMTDKVRLDTDGLLKVTIDPTDNATYAFVFTYGDQTVAPEPEKVVVIPAISFTIPETPTVCEGEEAILTITNVAPEGTSISWMSDPTIVEGENSESVRVKPTYSESADHQFTYTYTAVATNSICGSVRSHEVAVKVDEPLKGEISGVTEICQGETASFDASSYDATTYAWTSSDATLLFTEDSRQEVTPTVSSSYFLEMTRGLCSAKDTFVVTVHTNPVITGIDSIALRDRKIVLDPSVGEAPFLFAVDAQEADNNDEKYNLTFSNHIVYVTDVHGCKTDSLFKLEAPGISIPEYFTPNGNGSNDTWKIPNLADVYPNAVVRIFDRFGKLVAEMLGADTNGWDGTYKGNNLPATDYWYQITIDEINREYVGHFTLIRR